MKEIVIINGGNGLSKVGFIGRLVNGLKISTGPQSIRQANFNEPFGIGSADFTLAIACRWDGVATGAVNARLFSKAASSGPDNGTGFLLTIQNTGAISFVCLYQDTDSTLKYVATAANSMPINKHTILLITKKSQSANNWSIQVNKQILPVSSSGGTLSGSLDTPAEYVIGNLQYRNAALNAVTTDGSFKFKGYVFDVQVYNRELTTAEKNVLVDSELQKKASGLLFHLPIHSKKGKDAPSKTGQHGLLTGYTDVETASNGQPQSGNTAWVNAYTLSPITI